MDLIAEVANRLKQIPIIVWVLGAGLTAVLVAVFVFGYPLRSFSGLAFYALFIGVHFLMHSSHGGHGSHSDRNTDTIHSNHDAASGITATSAQNQDGSEHGAQRGGCH